MLNLQTHAPLASVARNFHRNIQVVAWNRSKTGEEAFTGEVSAVHLMDYRIGHVMIGHNERRKLFSESQEVINEKVKQEWDCDQNIFYCVGETAEQCESEQTVEFI